MRRKTFRIIYTGYIDERTGKITVGGIQTYIYNLCQVIKSIGAEVYVYQKSDKNFSKRIDGVEIRGVKITSKKYCTKLSEKCVSESKPNDVVIFASEQFIIPTKQYSIAIQHGIAWDKPEHTGLGKTANRLFLFRKAIRAYQRIRKIENVNKLICVDYNFVNWYRTQIAHPNVETRVIPNFSQIGAYRERNGENVNIIFARRFFPYRGTRIFASAIERILDKYENVNVLIAGSGPDENFLKDKFANKQNVKIKSFEAKDSLEIHKNYDIAVVPTLGSEGTSLSLLEAMASGCAVIATNVGGMTNIILDGYNGLIINPDENSLYDAIDTLVLKKEMRAELSQKAYETVKQTFSYEIWKNKWKEILEEIIDGK